MARKKQEEAKGGGSPAWMATFSDLMNLLLCFFVLLFAMSSVDVDKYELVVASINKSFSILNGGTDTIGDGELIGAGVSMLSDYDVYLNTIANSTVSDSVSDESSTNTAQSNADAENGSQASQDSGVGEQTNVGEDTNDGQDTQTGQTSDSNKGSDKADVTASGDAAWIEEQYDELSLSETEEMAEALKAKAAELGISDQVDINYNADYVVISISGALLFESGSADIQDGADKILKKICELLALYPEQIIEIEGHTDNVPIHSGQFADNRVLSTFRALSVADFVMANTDIDPYYIKYSGRGEYDPVADNSTAEGRARNRRVEIKIYSTYNSN